MVRTHQGWDIYTNHNQVVVDFRLKRFLKVKRKKLQEESHKRKKEISPKIAKEPETLTNSSTESTK